jgi:plasmid stabilization system protein ParE
MNVELSAEAERDLEEIADYIARDNPRRALTFILELRAKCLELGDGPQAYPVVPRFETSGIRRRVHAAYVIFCNWCDDPTFLGSRPLT